MSTAREKTRRDSFLAVDLARLREKCRARVWTQGYSPSTHAEQLRQADGLYAAERGINQSQVVASTTVAR